MKILCKGVEGDFTRCKNAEIEQQTLSSRLFNISDSKDQTIEKSSRHLTTYSEIGLRLLFKHVLCFLYWSFLVGHSFTACMEFSVRLKERQHLGRSRIIFSPSIIYFRVTAMMMRLLTSGKECQSVCSAVPPLFLILIAARTRNSEHGINCHFWMGLCWFGSTCLQKLVSGDFSDHLSIICIDTGVLVFFYELNSTSASTRRL